MPKPEPEDRPYDDLPGPNPFFEHPWKYVLNYASYKILILGSVAFLVFADYWLIRRAFQQPEHSFLAEFYLVLAAGMATFLAAPVIVACAEKWRVATVTLVLLTSILCGYAAFWREGTLGSLLVEASVSLLLLVALEMLFHRFKEAARKSYEEVKRKLDEGEEEEPSEPSEGDESYGWSPVNFYGDDSPKDDPKKE